ncbi:MAG TPA: NAD-dependent epimerase/dehydratase family protein [Ktedonobacteraceae bacterium]|nr:NAD-dependent epimerase/dehydratase family protein [Ktedonobacteraceae bacterium]
MRCLVTGVAGFIGSHLAERLLMGGHEVWGIDNFANYYPRSLKEHNLAVARSWNSFTLIEKDLLERDLSPLLDGVDWVFHLAAQAGVRASWGNNFASYVHNNVLATQRLLETVARLPCVRRFVYASSSSVYGETEHLALMETLKPQPYSPYGMTKLAAEHLCTLYQRNFGLPTVALRYFTVYGPRQRPDMALQRFCQAALAHEPLHVFGDGTQRRDFTFIDDIVEANLLAATTDAAIGEVLNIGSGSQATLREVLALLEEVSETRLAICYEPGQRGDVTDTLADISRARQVLGYTPQIPLRVGLARQFADLVDLHVRSGGSLVV